MHALMPQLISLRYAAMSPPHPTCRMMLPDLPWPCPMLTLSVRHLVVKVRRVTQQ